ncbi:MAG: Hsp20/alpha crystallin family protein [Anaerolineae bacterium]
MTETKEIQIQETEKQEIEESGAERTRSRRAFVPRVDIYETNDAIVMTADMPGVGPESVDITLEQGVLTINGYVEEERPEDYTLTYAEYSTGDYVRRFTLSNQIDQDAIEATVKDGVLRLYLPKVKPSTKKITVSTE